MRTAVIGGTGSVGRLVVDELVRRGDEVRVLSRSAPESPVAGATHHAVDLRTGAGLDAALAGMDVVVDAANGRKAPRELLVGGTRRALEAGAASGVGHHVLISIVGCDRVPMDYYRVKAEQERAALEGAVPATVLRATQFHTLLAGLFAASARFGIRPRAGVPLQLLDPRVAATRLADAAHAGPSGRLPDLAGPRRESAAELADTWSRATGRGRIPLRVPLPGATGRALREGALCAAAVGDEGPDFGAWLAAGGETA
jgi:uncharacterized protein YbjT (DUF2867 family)